MRSVAPTNQSGQGLIEGVISAATVVAMLFGIANLIALAWWAIAVPLVNTEMQRLVLKQLSLVQLVVDPPALGQLIDATHYGVEHEALIHSARWLLPAAPESWHDDELASGRLQLRCLVLKDKEGFLKLGCRTDWKTPFGWELQRADWISQRPGGTVDRFEGQFLNSRGG
jgi:hypothetical protein